VWDIFGWILGLVFTSLGVGALLLTRFGTRAYKNRSEKKEITEKK
jgi:hypothetical protein